jgi:hypothetical protein
MWLAKAPQKDAAFHGLGAAASLPCRLTPLHIFLRRRSNGHVQQRSFGWLGGWNKVWLTAELEQIRSTHHQCKVVRAVVDATSDPLVAGSSNLERVELDSIWNVIGKETDPIVKWINQLRLGDADRTISWMASI